MAYQPVGDDNIRDLQPAHLDNIELETRYDPGAYESAPPLDPQQDNGSKHDGDSRHTDDSKPLFKSQPPGSKWPVQARRVATITPLRGAIMFFDVVLASTPMMFVALALIAARLHGKEVSDYGERLAATLLLSPTIFPLIFAALMGRFFRHLGVYLAERGTTLGRLEQLIGCQSVFTALERQITLRSWSLVGLLSIMVWLLSPVGGQSALRLFRRETTSMVGTVRYLDPQAFRTSATSGASALTGLRKSYTSIFLAALLSSWRYQNTSMDLWGNVKLPLYRHIEHQDGDWKRVLGIDGSSPTYGSLIGVPVAGVPSEGLSNFSIKARQFDVTCSSNKVVSGGRNDSLWQNATASTWYMTVDKHRTGGGGTPDYPYPILSLSLIDQSYTTKNYSVASCDVNYIYLESKVRCNGTSCGITAMRKLNMFEDGYTKKDDDFTRHNMIFSTMAVLPTIDNMNGDGSPTRSSTNAEKWIANPENFVGTTFNNVDLHTIDTDTFSTRLTILWNTFFQSTYATTAIGAALPKNLTQTGMIPGVSNYDNLTFNATEAHITQQSNMIYKTNWKWFSALLVCSIILLIASYAGLVLKYISLAPDIIGYASSLTMLNPYVPTPSSGTTLHGLERAAALHDLPVKIGDVCPDEPVGAIAFARDDGRVTKLDRRRLYI